MAIDRRTLLMATAGLLLGAPARLLAGAAPQRLVSCRSSADGRHFATQFDVAGTIHLEVPLPARGHGMAVSPDGRQVAVFARRPGVFMIVIDIERRRVAHRVQAATGRHFYGHGVFSADGAILYATENAFEEGAGRIGVYDVRDGFSRLGEFDSHGVGPHELRLLADGHTLVVANGGIRTHPDMPRAKLNLDTMRSTLDYIDRTDGRLLETHTAPSPWQRLSIRHIDVGADDRVAMVMQYEGPKTDRPPLVGLHTRGARPDWLLAPAPVQDRMRNYCGSVAFVGDGRTLAVSSPRGGLVTFWDATGGYRGHFSQADVCGIAAADGRAWFSDGGGGLSAHTGETAHAVQHFADVRWDNHMVMT